MKSDYGSGTNPSLTVSVEQAAIMLGIGRGLAYETCRNGTFPVAVIRVGTRYRISRAAIEQLVGCQATDAA